MLEVDHIEPNPSWEDVEQYTQALASKIKGSDFEPNFVIGISRGGWVPAILLSHLLSWAPFASIDVKKEGSTRRVVQNHLNREALEGRKVLLVEDMLETGQSGQAAKEFLEGCGAEVMLACYCTRDFSEIAPNFSLVEGLTYEVNFPWERFRNKKF